MNKLIQVFIVAISFSLMSGSASGGTQEEIISEMCSKDSYPIEKNMIKVKGFYLGMSICDARKLMTDGKYKNILGHTPLHIAIKVPAEEETKKKLWRGKHPRGFKYVACSEPYVPHTGSGQPGDEAEDRRGVNRATVFKGKPKEITIYSISCGKNGKAIMDISAKDDGKVYAFNLNTPQQLFKSESLQFEKFVEVFTKSYVKGQVPKKQTYKNMTSYTFSNTDVGYRLDLVGRTSFSGGTIYATGINMHQLVKASEGFGD
jgi:hypothetical protein